MTLFIPQAAAIPDKINPQLANVVATAFVNKPDPIQITAKPQPSFDNDVLIPLKAKQQVIAQQEAVQAQQAALAAQQSSTPAQVVEAPQTTSTQPDNYYKSYIYSHESGNDPTRWNTSGCLGLGQACPASKLLAVCPTEDYACEDAWFSNYAQVRYGGWYNAYLHWQTYASW